MDSVNGLHDLVLSNYSDYLKDFTIHQDDISERIFISVTFWSSIYIDMDLDCDEIDYIALEYYLKRWLGIALPTMAHATKFTVHCKIYKMQFRNKPCDLQEHIIYTNTHKQIHIP